MLTQHWSYWCPGAEAPGHQYLSCWLNSHCIEPDSYWNSTVTGNNMRKAGPWAPKYSRPLPYGNKWCFRTNKPLLGRMLAARNRRSRADKGTDPLSSHERIVRTDKGYFSTIRTGDVRAGKDVMSVGRTSLVRIASALNFNYLFLKEACLYCKRNSHGSSKYQLPQSATGLSHYISHHAKCTSKV